MNSENLAIKIKDKAIALGFDHCGIVKVDAVAEYALCLEERIKAFPESKPYYDYLSRLAAPQKNYDWAKSIIVCAARYGKYKVPENIDNYIAKLYLCGGYKQPNYSKEYSSITAFETFLTGEGIKFAKELLGITPARMCAVKANLGVIRKNNFLYTEHGSWVWLETWLIDKELEYAESEKKIPSCPPDCSKCIDACPTGALRSQFLTDMGTCIARLTYSQTGQAPEHLRDKMGKWIYGCDDCQNACPMNNGKWEEKEEYPRLDELTEYISPEKIAEMDEKTLVDIMTPLFWIIGKDKLWMWKCNAIRSMANSNDAKYNCYIKKLCDDDNENVRQAANWACEKLGI